MTAKRTKRKPKVWFFRVNSSTRIVYRDNDKDGRPVGIIYWSPMNQKWVCESWTARKDETKEILSHVDDMNRRRIV